MTERTDPQFSDTQPPDFKAQASELSRQLTVSQAASQSRRLDSLNNRVWQAMQSLPEIKNTSIGK